MGGTGIIKRLFDKKNIDLHTYSLKKIDDLISSKDFSKFLSDNQTLVNQRLFHLVKPGNDQLFKNLLADYVTESLTHAKNK
ncbi:hypothetical protein GCM10022212_26980 [Actimicrobium antarcticum]|uniref:Uncharacterized protein n=1 Tax=Actimicrobium antarcticum TaxID=1051899 RepID=A0ABP7TK33_9BURK